MTASSTCQLLTALAFIMLMYIDMTTAPPSGLDCYIRKKRQAGGVCYTQQTYTYRQTYSTPCDYYRRKRARPWEDCGRTAYRMATGYRTVSSCCRGYEWDSICNTCTASCPGGCLNGGTCSYGDICICRPGYYGTRCESTEVACPGGCLNGGTCSRGTCICRTGFSGSRCQTEAVLEVTLTTTQQSALNTHINSLIARMGGSFNPSRLGEEQFYNAPLIDLNQAQQQSISDSCSEASEIFGPSERKKRSVNRVCPGRQRHTSLVAWTGSGNQVGQLVWLNGQTPWAFNEECNNGWGSGPFGSCKCEKVTSTSKALVLVINIGGSNSGVSAVWKDVTIRSCAATY